MDYTVNKISSKMRCFGGVYANKFIATTSDMKFSGFGETEELAIADMKNSIEEMNQIVRDSNEA
jgi:hypothetical protein